MNEIIKVPFRFDKLNAHQKEDVAKSLKVFGIVSEPIDVGFYTNFYLYTDLDHEYHPKESLEDESQSINGVGEYVKLCLNFSGYKVY